MQQKGVVFDIGGVLELPPSTGWRARWDHLGEIDARLSNVWTAGALGHISESEAEAAIARTLGLDATQLDAFMQDVWQEYLGELNSELCAYFAGLRPRCKTGILSNSFVGAREREERLYGFPAMCDDLVYSHEVGLQKPDPRIFQLSCQRLRRAPHEVVLLDDVEGHVLAARAFGMRAILFRDNAQGISDIETFLAI